MCRTTVARRPRTGTAAGNAAGVEEDSVNIIGESSCWRMAGWAGGHVHLFTVRYILIELLLLLRYSSYRTYNGWGLGMMPVNTFGKYFGSLLVRIF